MQTFDQLIDGSKAQRWLVGFSYKMSSHWAPAEDLYQEGLLEMWGAYSTRTEDRGNLDSYLIQAAKWRILSLLDGRSWTGEDRPHWHPSWGKKPRGYEVEIGYGNEVDEDWVAFALPEPSYETVEIDDSRREVRRVIRHNLTPLQRERVFKKWWRDEALPLYGAWWYGKNVGAREKLASQLGHLEGQL